MTSLSEKLESLSNWCTVSQACDILECSPPLVYKLLGTGRLAGWKTSENSNWKISKASLAKCVGVALPSEGGENRAE